MKPLSPVRAVLFDMDGVLVRSHAIWLAVVAEAGRRFRGHPVTPEEFEPTFGQGTAADVEVFGFRCSVQELDRFYVEHFGRHASGVWVDPDAAPVLAAISEAGLKRAVVTNTVSPLAEEILVAARLRQAFPVVACADQVPHAKPAPDLVFAALERLDVAADEALYVGDSRYDLEAAARAGVRFAGLRMDGDVRLEGLRDLLTVLALG